MVEYFVHNPCLIALCAMNAILLHFGQVTDGESLSTIAKGTCPNNTMGLYYECTGTSEYKSYNLCDGSVSAILKNNISLAYNDTEIAVGIFARDSYESNKFAIYQGDIILSLQPQMNCSNSLQDSCDISFVATMECIGNSSMQLPDLCCTFVFNSKYKLENGSQCLFWDGSKFENKLEDRSNIENCILSELNETSRKLDVCIEKSFGHFRTDLETNEETLFIPRTSIIFYLEFPAVILTYVGYITIIITFVVFRKWRRSNSHLVMLHFSIAAIMEISSDMVITNHIFKTPLACEIVEKIAHYSMLAYLCWLFIQCVLMYMRFVKVVGTYVPHFIWKASLFSWGTPLLIVGLNIAINAHETFYHGWTDLSRCYYPSLLVVNLFYIMPTGLILIGNMVIIVMVNKGIYCKAHSANLRSNQSEKSLIKRRLKATFASIMLLGLEWMLLMLSVFDWPNYNENILYQLHYLIGAWTGFAIFLILVFTDSSFKNVWLNAVRYKGTSNCLTANIN